MRRVKYPTALLLVFAVASTIPTLATAGLTELRALLPSETADLCNFISHHDRRACTLTCDGAGVSCTVYDGRLSVCGATLSSGEWQQFVVSHNVCG